MSEVSRSVLLEETCVPISSIIFVTSVPVELAEDWVSLDAASSVSRDRADAVEANASVTIV